MKTFSFSSHRNHRSITDQTVCIDVTFCELRAIRYWDCVILCGSFLRSMRFIFMMKVKRRFFFLYCDFKGSLIPKWSSLHTWGVKFTTVEFSVVIAAAESIIEWNVTVHIHTEADLTHSGVVNRFFLPVMPAGWSLSHRNLPGGLSGTADFLFEAKEKVDQWMWNCFFPAGQWRSRWVRWR